MMPAKCAGEGKDGLKHNDANRRGGKAKKSIGEKDIRIVFFGRERAPRENFYYTKPHHHELCLTTFLHHFTTY